MSIKGGTINTFNKRGINILGGQKMRFAEVRKILGYTQRQIAQSVGVSQQFWNDLEKGKKQMKKTTQSVLIQRWGINPDWLTGKNVSLYSDWEKGLSLVKGKSVLSRWEMLFMLEVMQHVWSLPSLQEIETRHEYFLSLCRMLSFLINKCKIEDENLAKYTAQYLAEPWISAPIPVSQAEMVARSVISAFKRDDLVLSHEDEKTLSDMLLPWGYYVALSYLTIKTGLVPVSSVFFSDLQDVLRSTELDENFVFRCKKEPVFFECKNKKFLISFEKGYILLDSTKAFAIFMTLMKAEKDVTKKVLDYEYEIFVGETDNVQITHHDITLILSSQEYGKLIDILRQFVTANPAVWLSLQKACLERFGFV